MEREESASSLSSLELAELVATLEAATAMAKQLPNTSDPTRITEIYSTLHSAQYSLSLFLAHTASPLPHPMLLDSMNEDIDTVEEKMKDCYIQNKRPKRKLSPTSVADEDKAGPDGEVMGEEFDPVGTKLRALDLIHQFHG